MQLPNGLLPLQAAALLGASKPTKRDLLDLVPKMREDHQVQLAMRVLGSLAARSEVAFETSSPDVRAQVLAHQLAELWRRTLPSMLMSLEYGWVCYEKDWRNAATPGGVLTHVRKLEPLPHDRTTPKRNAQGDFEGLELKGPQKTAHQLSPRQVWCLILDESLEYPWGQSRYQGAAEKSWRRRCEHLSNRDQFVRRQSLGSGIAYGPGSVDDPVTGEKLKGSDVLSQAIATRRAGGIAFLPSKKIGTGSDAYREWEYQIDDTPTNGAALIEMIDAMDAEQLLAFGIPPKTVLEGSEVGSFAMVSVQMGVVYAIVDDLIGQWSRSFERYVVRAAIKENWPDNAPQIDVRHTPLGETMARENAPPVRGDRSNETAGGPSRPFDLSRDTRPTFADVMRSVEREADRHVAASVDALADAMARQREPNAPDLGPIVSEFRFLLADIGAVFDLMAQVEAAADYAESRGEPRTPPITTVMDLSVASFFTGIFGGIRRTLADLISGGEGDVRSDLPRTRALDPDDRWRFPQLDDAVRWLQNLGIVSRDELIARDRVRRRTITQRPDVAEAVRSARAGLNVLDAPNARRPGGQTQLFARVMEDLRDHLVESRRRGESLEQFRERIAGTVGLAEHEANTIYRTYSKRATLAGTARTLENPVVRRVTPFVRYDATQDGKVRPHHWALDDLLASVGSLAYRAFMLIQSEWNCRCALSPATRSAANRLTVVDEAALIELAARDGMEELAEQLAAARADTDFAAADLVLPGGQ